MKKFLILTIVTVLCNAVFSFFPPEPTLEEKITEHVQKLGYHRKPLLSRDEFIVVAAKFFPKYANIKDSKYLRDLIVNYLKIGDTVLTNEVAKILKEDTINNIVRDTINHHNFIEDDFEEHYDKIDAEFKTEEL